MKEKLVEVNRLTKDFKIGKNKILKAVDEISFSINKGDTLGLVGESGCGKSTVGRLLLRIYEATSGEVFYRGKNIYKQKRKDFQNQRRYIQMIFQDPYSSLNPRMTVADIIAEGMLIHKLVSNSVERMERVYELLDKVGLKREHANRYPHEFSGGQRQRIGIARALAIEPEFIIADEPISALDVSIQAQIVNLMEQLQVEKKLTYLFIAHDLSMVKVISNRIGVMYLGGLVELAESNQLYDTPLHPYTQALLSAIPLPDPKIERTRERIILNSNIPSPITLPSGCRFHTRCSHTMEICREIAPQWHENSKNHWVACHLYDNSTSFTIEKKA